MPFLGVGVFLGTGEAFSGDFPFVVRSGVTTSTGVAASGVLLGDFAGVFPLGDFPFGVTAFGDFFGVFALGDFPFGVTATDDFAFVGDVLGEAGLGVEGLTDLTAGEAVFGGELGNFTINFGEVFLPDMAIKKKNELFSKTSK